MKLSKTPPINQAWRGIDLLSSFSFSSFLPADAEAFNVFFFFGGGRQVKEWHSLAHPTQVQPFVVLFSLAGLNRPKGQTPVPLHGGGGGGGARLDRSTSPAPPYFYGAHDFPHNEIFTGHWFPEK